MTEGIEEYPVTDYKVVTERWEKFTKMLIELVNKWWKVEGFSTTQGSNWISYSALLSIVLPINQIKDVEDKEMNSNV